MHSNYDYYKKDLISQPLKDREIFWGIEFFDKDAHIHEANLISFLRLIWLVGESIGKMFSEQYGTNSILEIDAQIITKIWGKRAIELSSMGHEYNNILWELGLWEECIK